jgi:16S rRNA (uracil1498-N3)-methyltransferase
MPATPAWPPKSAPRLFVAEKISLGLPISLEANQAHYLAKVMRVAPGDTVILCDDATGEWASTVAEMGKRRVTLEPVAKLREREPVSDFWLCPALLKRDRFDLVLEKATELGVAEIRPVLTRRCVADRLNAERAKAILTEAAEQCARTALPVLHEPTRLDEMVKRWPAERMLFFADEQGGAPAAEAFADAGPAALLIGPEGGFDEAERATVRALPQARPISLGPRILRGETAAIAGTALWMGLAGDWQKFAGAGPVGFLAQPK